MRLPSTNPITLPYGATSAPYTTANPHAGTDYAGGDLNSYAPEPVKVTAFYPQTNSPNNPCGNQLDFQSLDGTRKYRFCHSSVVYANVGQTYPEGTVLAKEGAVGLAYGVHLHCVMWVNGSRVDPDATIKSIIGEGESMTRDGVEKLVSKTYRVATDIDATPEQAGYWVERILKDNDTAYELSVALGADDYKGDPQFRYKGRHYDQDMQTKYEQGLKDGGGASTVLKPGKYQVS